MQVIIIEDEMLTAEDLAAILMKLPGSISVVKILSSVKESVNYLQANPAVDLIFCDIQLGDGHSFEIFKQVDTSIPVIFCTAYNQYALEAFNSNGIGYVLKPFTRKSIQDALNKFTGLKMTIAKTAIDFPALLNSIQAKHVEQHKPASLLINWKDKILPVKISDVALFYIEFKATTLITKDSRHYTLHHNLDELEQMCGGDFYRANRQCLVNRSAVQEVLQYTARKLFVKLSIEGSYDITIAKAKVPEFLSWLKS